MQEAFNKVLTENIGKRISIVSHGASIKFLLMKWCKINKDIELEFNKKVIKTNSPGIIKMIFEKEKLIKLEQIL